MERKEKNGGKQYKEAKDTLEARTAAKLTEKVTWYKGNMKRKKENTESKFQYQPATKRRKKEMKNQGSKPGSKDIKSVMFVPYTAHSELATRLRESEEKMKDMTGYKLKIVEKVGMKLVDILHKSDPWAGEECRRQGCLLCETKQKEGKKNAQDCHKRNCM